MTSSTSGGLWDRARSDSLDRELSRRHLFAALGVFVLVAGWHMSILVYDISRLVLPSPVAVAGQLIRLVLDSRFWYHVGISLFEFGAGFIIGAAAGVVIGLVMNELKVLGLALHPVIQGLRFIVPFAWISLTILWFGTSLTGKVLLVTYAVFFVMVVSTQQALRNVDPTLPRVATMLGMGRLARTFQVELRAAAPSIASAARAAAAIGWIAVVAAEFIGSRAGLGFLVINAATSVETAVVIAGMLVIGLVGAAISAAINWLSRSRLAYKV